MASLSMFVRNIFKLSKLLFFFFVLFKFASISSISWCLRFFVAWLWVCLYYVHSALRSLPCWKCTYSMTVITHLLCIYVKIVLLKQSSWRYLYANKLNASFICFSSYATGAQALFVAQQLEKSTNIEKLSEFADALMVNWVTFKWNI